MESTTARVPEILPSYVKTKLFENMTKVLEADQFILSYTSGDTGQGKTLTIDQVCAHLGKKMVRANITNLTNEDDLMGGYKLKEGNTVWEDGPVIKAMKTGSVLLLDELDQGTRNIMCLQPVLEGKSVEIKLTGETVYPAKGFKVAATGNTKGQGENTHIYIGANPLNEAFLDRFSIMFEHSYPTAEEEKEILISTAKSEGIENLDPIEADVLVEVAGMSRTVNDAPTISTRRLCQVIGVMGIFGDIVESFKNCITRFDQMEQEGIMKIFNQVYDEKKGQIGVAASLDKVTADPTTTGEFVAYSPFPEEDDSV